MAAERGGTTICCTRYGNVMCSRGSVIPLFIDQIRAGNRITITDPNMTRFLMNLDEAVDLVIFAFEHANPGDLFIQKSDASTIGDLAKAVQQLFGDTGTNIIGTRHGEKLFETLMTREERLRSEDMGGYYRVAAALGGHAGVGKDDVLHHRLGDAHGVDGIGGLVGGQADDALHARVNGGVQDIVRADDVRLHGLHREELAGGHLFQRCRVEDVVDAGHGIPDGLRVAHVADVELDLAGILRVVGLQLVAHVILFLQIGRAHV